MAIQNTLEQNIANMILYEDSFVKTAFFTNQIPNWKIPIFYFDIDLQSKKPESRRLETLVPTPPEPEISIPSWIKNNAGWWADGQIDDGSFVSGIQWLISNGVMTIPPTEQGTVSDNVIPGWIKNNAGWWSDGSIPDNAFVSGLQWLISNGIMKIS